MAEFTVDDALSMIDAEATKYTDIWFNSSDFYKRDNAHAARKALLDLKNDILAARIASDGPETPSKAPASTGKPYPQVEVKDEPICGFKDTVAGVVYVCIQEPGHSGGHGPITRRTVPQEAAGADLSADTPEARGLGIPPFPGSQKCRLTFTDGNYYVVDSSNRIKATFHSMSKATKTLAEFNGITGSEVKL